MNHAVARVRPIPTLAVLATLVLALISLSAFQARGEAQAGHRGSVATKPTSAETQAYLTAYNLTNRIAYLLDELSNAADVEEEDELLAQIRPLLHPDIRVVSDGREFSGRETVIEGMRFAHSRAQENAKRLETSPTILHSGLSESPPTMTIGTVQQHWWTDVDTGELVFSNRDTTLTIERVRSEWLVKENTLQTVIGPVVQE